MAFAFGHLIFAWFIGLIIERVRKKKLSQLSWGLLLAGSILPDIDYLFDWILKTNIHRTITHSLLFALILFIFGYLILKNYKKEDSAIFLSLGVISHLILDMIYPPGPMILWPANLLIGIDGYAIPILNKANSIIKLEYIDMGLGVAWLTYLYWKGKLKF